MRVNKSYHKHLIMTYTLAAPEDFQEVTRTLTFSQSNTREVFAVQIESDSIDEEDEEFQAVLSLDSGEDSVSLIPAQTTVVINDDDG